MTVHWYCLHCKAHGETTGKESGADAKHARVEGHTTVTTTSGEWAARRAAS